MSPLLYRGTRGQFIRTGEDIIIPEPISYWNLDEVSGARFDALPIGNDLTDTNTVGSAAGKIGLAGDFVKANSELLTITDNASLSVTDQDFTLCGWVRLTSKPAAAFPAITRKFGTMFVDREYSLAFDTAADRFIFVVWDSVANTATILPANSFGAVALNTFFFVVGWYTTSPTRVLHIQVNNGQEDTTAHSGPVADGGSPFNIGGQPGEADAMMDGRIDMVGFWKEELTAPARTQLFNNNAGRQFPF